MKFDKLSVVVGGALLIFIAAYIILQYVKSLPANRNAPLVPSNQSQIATPTPASLPNTSAKSDKNIIVSSPLDNQSVSVPFNVAGKARVFENQFNYRVLDQAENIMVEGTVMVNAADAESYGNYLFTVSGISIKGKVTLEVFDYSAKDGSIIDKVSIPLNIK